MMGLYNPEKKWGFYFVGRKKGGKTQKSGAFASLEERREGQLNRKSNMDHEKLSKDIYILIITITSHEILDCSNDSSFPF